MSARQQLGDECVTCGSDEWYVYDKKGKQFRQCAPCAVARANKGDRKKLYRYGLTQEEYDQMAGRGCAICGAEDDLCVYHCHETEEVRGVLCRKCNSGIGLFNDDPELVEEALRYLYAGVVKSASRRPSKP